MRRTTKRPSGKGTLLQGMSRRLPRELLADPLFRKRLAGIMRRQAGIYALYDGRTPYYQQPLTGYAALKASSTVRRATAAEIRQRRCAVA